MEHRHSPRKKGVIDEQQKKRNLQKAALQEVLPGYEEYLVLLQERNRLLKKMRKKSSRQIENERKEQGFSLYVSGANADKEKAGKPSKPSSHKCMSPEPEERSSKPSRLKTAGDVTKKRMIGLHDLEMLAADEKRKAEEKRRLKTAPARERRRNWMAGSVDIKTERGERCKLRPPETVTGDYDDDFEDDESDEEKVKMEMSNALEDSDSDIEIDASKHTKNPPLKVKPKAPPPRSSQETFSDSDPESEGENEKLLLSLADIKRLRASLAMNKSIRESLAKEVSSDFSSSDEEILEHIQSESSFEDEESREPPSPIAEDVEEDLVPAMDSVCLNDNKNTPKKKSPFLKPTDTVVLELAAPPTKNKVERNLSAARKKDVDLDEDTSLNRVRKSYNSESKPRAQSATVLQSNTPRKSSNRPLSANRVSQKEKLDSDAEANAVMRALREENEKASRLKQEASSHKLPHTSQKQVLSGGKPMASPRKSIDPPKKSSDPSRSSLASPRYSSEQRPSSASSSRNVSKHPSSSVEKRPPSSSSSLSKNKSAEPSSTANVNQSFLSDERLTDVMKKVMLMQPKQQKRLFRMLGNLEESTESGDKSETVSRTPPSKPVKATVPVKDMVSPVTENKPLSLEDTVEVNIELLSTWGHKELIGLTELQFFDERWQLIKLTSSNISVHGCRAPSSNLDVLFNGKAKSNKDRNMWCCKYRPRVPVEICVSVPTTHAGMEVSKIKIWNYNKSLTELDIGVKHARIFVGGELIFDGNIEKGCGNQVFDYGFNVYVKDNDKVSPRDEDKSSPKSLSPVIHVRSPRTEKVVTQKQNVRSPSPSTRPSNGSSHTASESTRATATHSTKVDRAPIRSETRTMNHSERNLPKPVVLSDRSGSETEEGQSKDDSKNAKKPRGSRTPRKSKRMAAKLDGHSSTETDNSKSITDSTDHSKPPVSQARSSKDPQGGDKEGKEVVSPVESKGTEAAGLRVEDSMLGTQDSDDIPMLQKLKEMNQNTKDQKRKKDVPKWLKQEEVPGPFENPVDSQPSSKPEETATPARPSSGKRPGTDKRQGMGERDAKQGTKESNSRPDSGRRPGSEKSILPTKDHMKQTHQEDVDMLIDEELAMNWPEKGVPHLNTVFDKEKVVEKPQTNESSTPMQKIQQNRAKWRDNQKKNLEESWGQLNMFDRHQKGRISMDLDDDALDEYLQPSKKAAPQPSIKEEEDDEKAALAAVEEELDMDNFVIPELPYGRELVIDIKSTWGDRHYVGLTGIELFSSTGEPVTTTKIHANPLDINILSEYEKDPRVINNLIDGVNRTRDDVHMWLAPFTPNGHHYIYITFEKACKISLMRIWNYNKSRIHSYRGAKDVVITLDSTEIFKGEIARACGGIEGGTEAFGDTILFTTDETILEAVSKNDDAYEGDLFSDDEPDDVPFERPSTADEGSDDERPFTRAAGNLKKAEKESASIPPRPATSMVTEGDVIVFKGKRLELNFTATWGDLHYLGLTGIEVVGKEGEALSVNLNMITATPRDLHHLQGHERDDRTLDKVIDGTNVTMSDEHMWLIPFQEGNDHMFVIDFPQTQLIAGLRIWNYNKSPEDTYRGAKIVHVTIDGKQLSPAEGYLIRKGPGNCHFDYAQEISFAPQQQKTPSPSYPVKGDSVRSSVSDDPLQEYESMQMPCGFIYQLQLISTWGDQYYVGLNGLEFFDAMHNKIELTENNISAYPDSINVLSNMQNDVRTPDKLIDNVNSTTDGRHMWLAPILPSILNRVYVIFDQPTAVSMIKIWNYSKTPGRGAKDFALLVDDLLVYNGMLSSIRQGAKGILPTAEAPQSYHTIIFTDNKDVIKKEKHSIISNQAGEQDIQLTNDKQVVSHYNDPKKAQQGKPVNQELRPKTSVTGMMKKRR